MLKILCITLGVFLFLYALVVIIIGVNVMFHNVKTSKEIQEHMLKNNIEYMRRQRQLFERQLRNSPKVCHFNSDVKITYKGDSDKMTQEEFTEALRKEYEKRANNKRF